MHCNKDEHRSSALVHKPEIAGPELNDLILTSGNQFAHSFGGELDDGLSWVLFQGLSTEASENGCECRST